MTIRALLQTETVRPSFNEQVEESDIDIFRAFQTALASDNKNSIRMNFYSSDGVLNKAKEIANQLFDF